MTAAIIAGSFAVFAFTRMFASPIRPRTMTKEWQEASEEYLQVRGIAIRASIVSALTHHRPRVASQLLATRECWSRASLRRICQPSRRPTSKDFDKSIRAYTPDQHQYRYLFSLSQLHAWCCFCHIYNNIGSGMSRCLVGYCHISPLCTEIIEVSARSSSQSPLWSSVQQARSPTPESKHIFFFILAYAFHRAH
jgi:hypothetical protein